MKQCILCSNEIIKDPEDSWKVHYSRKFCDKTCYNEWKSKFKKDKKECLDCKKVLNSHSKEVKKCRNCANKIERKCIKCAKVFLTTYSRQFTCSDQCSYTRRRDNSNRLSKKYHTENRKKAIEYYGGKCNCCGEKEYKFLAIDHINGRNKVERVSTREFYNNFRKGIFPKDYQLLCHNCNSAKGFYGQCPHEYN